MDEDRDVVGVLLTDADTGEEVAFIEFTPVGALCFAVIQPGLHVFALKPLERILSSSVFTVPLSVRYAAAIEKGPLPSGTLKREAERCAAVLNGLERPLVLKTHTVKARSAFFMKGMPRVIDKAGPSSPEP
jgi:hypothetical protein